MAPKNQTPPGVTTIDYQKLADAIAPKLQPMLVEAVKEHVRVNTPQQLAHGFAVQFKLLTADECLRMSAIMSSTLDQIGRLGDIKTDGKVHKETRHSRLCFVDPYDPPDEWEQDDTAFVLSVFLRLVGLTHVTQATTLRNSIPPLAGRPAEQMQFTEYKRGMHYKAHQDSDGGNKENRAMSLSLTIENAEKGGEFQFRDVELPEEFVDQIRQPGSVIIFPSSAYHEITRVTKGLRRSIVMWHNALQVKSQ